MVTDNTQNPHEPLLSDLESKNTSVPRGNSGIPPGIASANTAVQNRVGQKEKNTEPQNIDPRPAVRTMKSDVEKLFKNAKPSLIQPLPQSSVPSAIPSKTTVSSATKKSIIVFLVVLIAILGGAVGFTYFTARTAPPAPPPPPPLVTPGFFFQAEKTTVVTGTSDKPASIFEAIQNAARTTEPDGTVTYIPIKLQDNGKEKYATLSDFLQMYHMNAPLELSVTANGTLMPFLYYGGDGMRFGLAFQSRDPSRTLHDLMLWEPLLLTDMAPFFFGEKYASATAFSDNTFRNIDWRFLNLSQDKDFGIAYMFFPAKNLFIITASRGAIETSINRLYTKL